MSGFMDTAFHPLTPAFQMVLGTYTNMTLAFHMLLGTYTETDMCILL